MQKKDLSKQQRRKRKDPQSRDFKCSCGKSYLSYAAVYTHVKNKHGGDKEYEDAIVKPQKEKLKRGRPRDKKKIVISSQTQILSICEQTTLLIYEQLKQHKDKFKHHIILQGNEEMDQIFFNKEYKRLNSQREVQINLLQEEKKDNDGSEDEEDIRVFEKFLKGVIKHFNSQIAARASYVVNYFAEISEEINFQDRNEIDAHMRYLEDLNIWQGENQINYIIYKAMLKWLEVIKKEEQNEQQHE